MSKMRFSKWFAVSIMFMLAGAARAQSGAPPVLPPLVDCGGHGDIEILCGTNAPEDLEVSPDGKYLIATQFLNQGRGGPGGGMALFDLSKKTFSKMTITSEPDKSWGDPACPGPIGDA